MTATFERTKPHLNVGTIGHSQHGKTTLTAAILKVLARKDSSVQVLEIDQIDKEAEEKARHMTINANHVEYQTAKRHYAHVDCPGHVNYIKNMFVGAAQMDGAILVVSAADRVQAQTREHIWLARQAGVNYILVFINKCDTVEDPDQLDLLELEVREMLTDFKFDGDNTPMVRGSALKALEGNAEDEAAVERLMDSVDQYIPEPERLMDLPFLMPVGDVFVIGGRGTAVAGCIARGTIKVGDEVEVVGVRETKKTVVTGVETFKKIMDQGQAGDYVGLLLRGMGREDLSRDHVLAKPGSVTPHKEFVAEVYVLRESEGGRKKPFFKGYKPQFYIRTADVHGTVTLREGTEMVMPGDNATLTVELAAPVELREGLRFAARDSDRTVMVGVVARILR